MDLSRARLNVDDTILNSSAWVSSSWVYVPRASERIRDSASLHIEDNENCPRLSSAKIGSRLEERVLFEYMNL